MRSIKSSSVKSASNGNGSAVIDPAAQAQADQQAQAQAAQVVATAGAAVAKTLSRDIVRRTLMAAIGSVKRADLLTNASDPHGRAGERITAAKLGILASDLATLASNLATLADSPYRVLKSANVGTKSGSVSTLALMLAIGDASSKSDALAQFAGE